MVLKSPFNSSKEPYMSRKAETKLNLVSAEKKMKKNELVSGVTCFGYIKVSGVTGKFSAETGYTRN